MTSPAERLTGLLNYLEQVERLRRSTAFSVPDEFFRAYQADIEGLPGVGLDLPHGGDDVWLSLPRLGEIPPPPPSAALEPWISFSKSADEPPRLQSEVVLHGGDEETRLSLQHFPGVSRLLDAYVAQHWIPWANAESPRRRAIALYNRLFALYRLMRAEAVDSPLELVWGLGLACWRPSGGKGAVAYPLLTQSCELLLDEDTLELVVQPRAVDAVLELEPFVELAPPGVAALAAAWVTNLKASEERHSPFNATTTVPVLKAAATLLDADGRFEDLPLDAPMPEAGERLLVTNRWVLFARRRPGTAHLEDIRRIKRRLKDTPDVSAAPARLLGVVPLRPPSSAASEAAASARRESGAENGTVLLPLASNDPQRAVVELLERTGGVVVEAPPGTGATQTVANLICHCLATGKRILVTSPVESSLVRTQFRVPNELRSLTVAVVADERGGMRQLAHCIKNLSDRLKAGGEDRLEREIADLESRLAELQAAIAAIDANIGELADRQLGTLPIDERRMTAAELARVVTGQAPMYEWLADPLDPATQQQPRVTEQDMTDLRTARMSLGDDLAHLGANLPEPTSLPAEAALLELNRILAGARRTEQLSESRALLSLLDGSSATFDRASRLRDLLRRRNALRAEISKDPLAWADWLRGRFAGREDGLARDLVTVARSVTLEELSCRARRQHDVEVPADAELSGEVMETVARRAEGGFSFRLPLGGKDAKPVLDAMTVDGDKPEDLEAWQLIAAELEHRVKSRKLLAAWNAIVTDCRLDPVKETGARAFREMAERADFVLKVHELVTRVEAPIRVAMPTVFPASVVAELPEHEESSYKAMLDSLNSHLDRDQTVNGRSRLRELLRGLEERTGPSVDAIWRFLTAQLGRDDSPRATEALALTWRGLVGEISRIMKLAPLFQRVERVAALVELSGASGWARRLRTIPAARDSDPVAPSDWREAWRWRIAVMLLGTLEGHSVHRQLLQRRHNATAEISKLTRAVVVSRAWLSVLRRASERQRQALREYTHSLRALGHGAGVRGTRNREISSAALAKSHAAIPCWLLPVWRVPDFVPADLASFDVVVVEEASRADLTALGAVLRGRKVVVIGDSRQLPPPAAGVDERRVKDLNDRFLADQPQSGLLAPDRSLLELAHQLFPDAAVEFREQFAGDPAITELVNRDLYRGTLDSMRPPVVPHHLRPALVDVHVAGGLRRGAVNEAEALAVVAEVEAVMADETLAGRSVGVASLLGSAQAQRIDQLLCERIALRSVIDRKILVGTPATFSGCERSLMLLSLGMAPNERDSAATTAPAAFFNVACARNVDRMSLFRSVSAADLASDSPAAILVRRFAEAAQRPALNEGAARELCDTDLERELYDELTGRGFRVRPHHRLGSVVFDLLVEGSDGRRLAIACDGDRPAGSEGWRETFSRQLALERLGWAVWRCFASSLILHREHVLDDLWGTLERLGIDAPGPPSAPDAVFAVSRTVPAAVQAFAPTLTNPVRQGTTVGGTPRRRETPPG